MKRGVIRKWVKKAISGRSSGASLVEVVIAVVVLAFVVATVPAALLVINHNQYRWSEERIAESLVRNQIEYVKVTAYIAGNSTNPQPEYNTVPVPVDDWEIEVVAQPIDPETRDSLPLDGEEIYDKGLQKVTVVVNHVDNNIMETTDYKGNRTEIWRPGI